MVRQGLLIFFLAGIIAQPTLAQWYDIYPGTVTVPVNAQGHGIVKFFNIDTGYALTAKSIEKTVNGGTSWQLLDTANASTTYYRRMFMVDADTGFIFGNDISGLFLRRTTDGGASFIQRSIPATQGVTSAWFFSADTGFVTCYAGKFLRTYDGGSSWTVLNIGTTASNEVSCVFFVNRMVGYVSSHPGHVHKTTDGGLTWNLAYNGFGPYMRYIHFTDADHGYAVDFNIPGSVMKTVDGGITWSTTVLQDYGLSGLQFTSADTGYILGSQIYRTTDAGAHWYGFTFPGTGFGGGFSAIDNNTIFAPIGFEGTARIENAAFSCPYALRFLNEGGFTIDTLHTCVNDAYQVRTVPSHAIPYMYTWSPANYLNDTAVSNPVINMQNFSDTMEYTVTITDTIFGCPSVSDTLVVITDASDYVFSQEPSPAFTRQVFNCTGDTVVLDLGQGAMQYTWGTGDTTRYLLVADTVGSYSGTALACNRSFQFYFFLSPGACDGDVWPGDCNGDLVADNLDLLEIGQHFATFGFSRPGASVAWVPQRCATWDEQGFAHDGKYVDTDGDGHIGMSDTLAIVLNYGLNHPARSLTAPSVTGTAELALLFADDTLQAGQTVSASIDLSTTAGDSIYGLAFRLALDTSVFDVSASGIDFSSSVFGTPDSSMIVLVKHHAQGRIDIAVTGIDGFNRAAVGTVGILTLKARSTLVSGLSQVSFSDVVALDSNEDTVALAARADSIWIDPGIPSSIHSSAHYPVRIYPNPAGKELFIEGLPPGEVTICNLPGQVLGRYPAMGQLIRVDCSSFAAGTYFLRWKDGGISYARRFVLHPVR